MAELLIGVDLGTTGTKTALYSPDGRTLATATAATPLRWQGPGVVDQDPDDFYSTATETIASCVRKARVGPGAIAAIGVTGQMAGTMGIDRDWRPATTYDSWLDLRCSDDVVALDREVGEELVRLAGCPAMINHAPKIRWRRRERPQEFEATAAFVPPSSYVAGRLAGLRGDEAFIDRTYLHFSGLADSRAGTWSERLAGAVGVPLDKLPRIVEPASVIGELTAASASACGLRPGVAVAAGLGDTAAGVLGAGIVRPGQLLDTAGTAAVFAISAAELRPDLDHRTLISMRGALPGQWVSLSYLSGGGLLDWTAALFDGEADHDATDYRELGEEAEQAPPGSDGLIFIPHLDGRLLPSQPRMRGAWVGLTRRHRREHLTRSVLESVAYEYSGYLGLMRELHPELEPRAVRVIGGGARSEVWSRIKASVLGLPYERLDREEFSCLGAALVAGAAVGAVEDLATAAETATATRESLPPYRDCEQLYGRMCRTYEDVIDRLGAAPTGPVNEMEVIG